jgi:hypothetical protein
VGVHPSPSVVRTEHLLTSWSLGTPGLHLVGDWSQPPHPTSAERVQVLHIVGSDT